MGSNPIARSKFESTVQTVVSFSKAIRRRSQVVKAGVCKTLIVGSNPTVASESGRK